MIKRYELDYVWKWKNSDLSIVEFEFEGQLIGFRQCNNGKWVKYDDIKHCLSQSEKNLKLSSVRRPNKFIFAKPLNISKKEN